MSIATTALCLEAVLPGSTADVENAPVHKLEHLLLLGGPLAVLGEEDLSRQRRACAAVVELEGQLTRLPRRVIEERRARSS